MNARYDWTRVRRQEELQRMWHYVQLALYAGCILAIALVLTVLAHFYPAALFFTRSAAPQTVAAIAILTVLTALDAGLLIVTYWRYRRTKRSLNGSAAPKQ